MASLEESEILVEFLLKRSKAHISTKTVYKGIYLVLTGSALSIHEGSLEGGKREKLKKKINLRDIRAVELVDTSVDGKKYAFQVVHVNQKLKVFQTVIVAQGHERVREWTTELVAAWKGNIKSVYKTMYHPGAWCYQSKSYPCCGNRNDQSEGCQPTVITPTENELVLRHRSTIRDVTHVPFDNDDNDGGSFGQGHEYEMPSYTGQKTQETGEQKQAEPTTSILKERKREQKQNPIWRKKKGKKTVVVIEDYTPEFDNCLQLSKGEQYTIIDYHNPDWWMAVKKDGAQGYVLTQKVQEVIPSSDTMGSNSDGDLEHHGYVGRSHSAKEHERPIAQDNLEQQEWYYSRITREECEDLLTKEAVVGCFLVRPSSQTNCYALSIYYKKRSEGIVEHYLIRQNNMGHYYLFDEPPRATLSEVVRIHMHNSGGLTTRLTCSPDQNKKRQTDFTNHQIDIDELEMLETIGTGQFGLVKKARWRGQIDVAVKMVRSERMRQDEFIQEAKTMLRLQHVRLVQLYGVVSSGEVLELVTEYMANGSLSEYLQKTGHEILKSQYRPIKICHQICLAMDYLESQNFIHRDLAARNCLVGPNEVVKVGDFGLARYILEGVYVGSYDTQFAPAWAPPEVLKDKVFTSKSDVWSFGVVMWEVYTMGREKPYGKMPSFAMIENLVCVKGTRLQQPRSCNDKVYEIMLQCWAPEAIERPMFNTLLQALADLVETESAYENPALLRKQIESMREQLAASLI